jgi:hypothetical protein
VTGLGRGRAGAGSQGLAVHVGAPRRGEREGVCPWGEARGREAWRAEGVGAGPCAVLAGAGASKDEAEAQDGAAARIRPERTFFSSFP